MQPILPQTALTLERERDVLATAIVARHWEQQPDLAARYDDEGRRQCVRDVSYHLSYLAQALRAGEPALFVEYVAWLKVLFARLNLPAADLIASLAVTADLLHESLPPAEAAAAGSILTVSLARLPTMAATIPSFLANGSPYAPLAASYLESLLHGDRRRATRLILDAVAAGAPVRAIYLEVFQPCLREIGRLWQANEVSVAQEHFCTAATQLIMSQLYPHIFSTPRSHHRLVAACVGQELHEVGLRMVADLFELDGWDTCYLGANTPVAGIATAAVDFSADILAISATMTFHLPAVIELIAHVRATAGPQLKIMVGGYPFNTAPNLWRRVGADGYAPDAAAAVTVAWQLIEGAV